MSHILRVSHSEGALLWKDILFFFSGVLVVVLLLFWCFVVWLVCFVCFFVDFYVSYTNTT